jgi:hypothetical protein
VSDWSQSNIGHIGYSGYMVTYRLSPIGVLTAKKYSRTEMIKGVDPLLSFVLLSNVKCANPTNAPSSICPPHVALSSTSAQYFSHAALHSPESSA